VHRHTVSAESAIHSGANRWGMDHASVLNRAFSARYLPLNIFLGRCPRLRFETAPLALNTNPAFDRAKMPGDGQLSYRRINHSGVPYFACEIVVARLISSCEKTLRSNRSQSVRAKSSMNRCGNPAF
jgi:hypothetical protein